MRLCIITDSLSNTDGPGRYSLNMIEHLQDKFSHIDILVPKTTHAISCDFKPHCSIHSILPSKHLYYIQRYKLIPIVIFKAFQILNIVRKADIVHSFKDYPFSLIGAIAAFLAGKRFFVTAHGSYSVIPFNNIFDNLLLRFVYFKAEKIVSVSNYTKNRISYYIDTNKIKVISSGVDFDYFNNNSQSGSGQKIQKPFILSVGEIKERKGYDTAIEAFAQVSKIYPALRYYIVGQNGHPAYTNIINKLIERHSLQDKILFFNNITEDMLKNLYKNCEFFILMPKADKRGHFEGFGLVYLEAAACGKPAIATKNCGAEDAIVNKSSGLLVSQGDVQATAKAMSYLLDNEEIRNKMGEKAREVVCDMSWNRTANEIMRMYKG